VGVDLGSSPPAVAGEVFGDRLPLAVRYARWFAGAGVERGLVGPHEAGRVWQRHIMNCVAVGALIEPNSVVVDIGSGAGLPGIVLAIARPDLRLVLVDSMLRRTAFLEEVVADLGLSSVSVRRARAEDLRSGNLRADVVTARALAPIDRLAGWAAPLLAPTGSVLALKGKAVADDISAGWTALRRSRLAAAVELVALVAATGGIAGGAAAGSFLPGIEVIHQGGWADTLAGGVFVAGNANARPDADPLAFVVRLGRYPQEYSRPEAAGLG
jgi:16S rRNA (guanine527-N7)-methyltransferase